MKIYIQSKTGKFNTVLINEHLTPDQAMMLLRVQGGYATSNPDGSNRRVVPFEEIEYVREATSDDREA